MNKKRTKWDYNLVKNIFESDGYTLISKKFNNTTEKLELICPKKHICHISLNKFVNKRRCKYCTKERLHTFLKSQEFKDKYKKTSIERYGVSHPSQSQIFENKKQETNLKKYGYKHVSQSPKIRKKIEDNYEQKYGVRHPHQRTEVREKFKKTLKEKYGIESLAYLGGSYSKISQELFWSIYNNLSIEYKDKTYFATLNKEFITSKDKTTFKYDFVNTKYKICIEYNGSKFHPKDYQLDDETNWCIFHPKLTVKEARIREQKKLNILIERGYKILIIWDYEYLQNKKLILEKCLDFILNN